MIEVTYKTYSKLLKKHFINTKQVKSIEAFRVFNSALHHGQAEIVSINGETK
tara:strand:+ start:213 stop:368 length:156 start_codon:yes stop_codon:yes gene_type:complete